MATNIEKVRLKIADINGKIYDDTQIQTFLDCNSQSVNLAAADALEAMAVDFTLNYAKLEQLGQHIIDRRKNPDDLRKLAAQYRKAENETPAYAFAESANSDFTAREISNNQALRGN